MSEIGKVFLVGAGPGDPGLVTVRARQLIETCDVLVFDYLVNPALREWAPVEAEQIDVGKSPGLKKSALQVEIEAVLVDRAQKGKRVVRLKGGDPFIFGRGGEEVEALLAAGIPFEVVPGVTASLGAAAYLGIPLTDRRFSSSVTLVTGHEAPEGDALRVNFAEIARTGGTLAIYMGMTTLPVIVAQLLEGGCPPALPVAVVQWATYPGQRSVIGTLESIARQVDEVGLASPAIIVVGEVVRHAERYRWFHAGPLAGKRIVVTRSTDQAGGLRERLSALGADVVELPMITTRPAVDRSRVAEIFVGISTYEWIVFTSPNGVKYFFEAFLKAFDDIRCFGGMRIACVGKATARALQPFRLAVDLIPKEAVAEAMGKALVATDSLDSANVLVVTGNRNRDALVRILEEEGRAIVDALQVYETSLNDWADRPEATVFREKGADYVVFTSSSTVQAWSESRAAFATDFGVPSPRFVSMGPITSRALAHHSMSIDLEAPEANLESLVQAIVNDLKV